MFELTSKKEIDSFDITVEIVDAIMGSGKSTEIFKWVDANPDDKYIYVSPLVSEVGEGGRVHKEIMHTRFHSPSDEDGRTKSEHLLWLLEEGLNICCTHSLYLLMDFRHLSEIEKRGYIVILDEELGVVNSYSYFSKSDLASLVSLNCIKKQESDGMLVWTSDDPNFDDPKHKYYKLKRDIEKGIIYSAKRAGSMLVSQLPIKLFSVAKRVVIITYMFDGNILSSFLSLKGVKYKPFTEIILPKVDKSNIRSLINMYEVKGKWKDIEKMKLSSSWYVQKGGATPQDIKMISNFISSFSRATFCDYADLMYTFPKDRRFDSKSHKSLIKPKGLIDREIETEENGEKKIVVEKTWIATQTRATNIYRHKTRLVHAFNRFPNTNVKAYFQDFGKPVDIDVFALSEMTQWIWRSAIRQNQEITLCILSPRMRNLFMDWLNDDEV